VRLACLSKFSVHDRDDTQSEAQEHTQDLKRIKKQKMKDIIKAMEAFNENLVGGKRLVKALERDTPIGTMGIHLISISIDIDINHARRLVSPPACPPTRSIHTYLSS